jgi:lysophospholipase L1-like esterase
MNNTSPKHEIFVIILGIILILIGLLCNEHILSLLLCPDTGLEQHHKMNIRIAEIFMIGIGLALILFRKKDLTINISILLLTLIIIFAGTEAFFRVFYTPITGVSEHKTLFEYHNELGWQMIPGKTGVYVSKHEFKTMISINSAGMRDIEYSLAKPAGKKRIVILGDSFVSSMGVDVSDAFTEIMEFKLLKNTEVLNFGVNGYGPAQELLLLRKRAIKYQPDLVVMVIFLGNDFNDISGLSDELDGYKRPKAFIDNRGKLQFSGIPVPLSKKHTFSDSRKICGMPRSHFVDFINKTIKLRKHEFNVVPAEVFLCRKNADARTKESYRLMGEIIKETNDFCKKNGATFMIAVAPSIVPVYEHLYWAEIKKKYSLNDHDYDLMLPNKIISDICKNAGIPIVDLTSELKAAAKTGNDTYYFINLHWNKAGEQIVAEVLSDYIIRNKLLEK